MIYFACNPSKQNNAFDVLFTDGMVNIKRNSVVGKCSAYLKLETYGWQ